MNNHIDKLLGIPVIIRRKGKFFSAAYVSTADFAMLEKTTHSPFTVHRSTPLRVEIVNRAIDKGGVSSLVNFDNLRADFNDATDWDAAYYPVRGFDVTSDRSGRRVIRQTARLERESSRPLVLSKTKDDR